VTTAVCPNGHHSGDAEWCDTCGAPIGGSHGPAPVSPPLATPSAPSAAPSAGLQTDCPNCGLSNDSDNLFCEQCGYDFTTGQAPPQPLVEGAPAGAASMPDSTVKWVVVVEVDQAWYELKGSLADEACPPTSSSTFALAQHTALVGRSSRSRGVHPEIALDGDTGVSRRHAQFVRDGDELAIIDLSSTNGTYVVPAGSEPDDETAALVAGLATLLHDGDRVYVGAWSRLTVRLTAVTR
jgi:FHA domain-containing protein